MNDNSSTRIEMLKAYISEDPADPFTQYALALEYIRLSNNADAITLLERIVNEHANYLPAYYQLGKLYEKNSRNEEALNVYNKGMELAKKLADLHTLSELRAAADMLDE